MNRFLPLEPTLSQETEFNATPLVWLAAIGTLLMVAAAVLDIVLNIKNIVPAILLEVGGGIGLFAALFYVERRFVVSVVRTETKRLIEALTWSPDQVASMSDDPDLVDFANEWEPGGRIDIAHKWFVSASSGDYDTAWGLSDENWQYCRIQAWLWNNQTTFGSSIVQLEETANSVLSGTEPEIRQAFMASEREQFLEAWGDLKPDEWGVSSRRRRIAFDHDVVLLVPLGEYKDGLLVNEAAIATNTIPLTMRKTPNGWRLASHLGGAPPHRGWPPAWWIPHDPALKNVPG
jgi:hypothetical protein